MPPLCADVTFSTEGMVVISALLASVVGALVFVHRLLMQSQNERIEAEKLRSKSYREIAEEAVRAAETKVTPEVKHPAPIVAEHHSETTQAQQETADLQTLRARVTAVALAAGLPPRPAGIPAVDTVKVTPAVAEKLLEEIAEVKEIAVKLPDKVVEKIKEQSPEGKQP